MSRMNPMKPGVFLVVAALVSFGWISKVRAEERFPSEIQRDLSLSYQVPCSVCHIKGNVAASTPITPFALSLRARGLADSRSLTTALQQLEADTVDSDGDGTSDIAELKAGTDPNSSGNANIIGDQEPGYGCGGTAPTGRNGGQAFALAAAAGWLIRRRRDVRDRIEGNDHEQK